jgi:hypothetical protein
MSEQEIKNERKELRGWLNFKWGKNIFSLVLRRE